MKSLVSKVFALTMLVGVIASCAASVKVDPIREDKYNQKDKEEDTRSAKKSDRAPQDMEKK